MSRYDEYRDALKGRVTFRGDRHEPTEHALASAYSRTIVPVEHVGLVSHFSFGEPQQGSGSLSYTPGDQGIHSSRDIAQAMSAGAGYRGRESTAFLLAHETGHRLAHVMQPAQFMNNLQTPQGRGYIEAHADNYAHGAMPRTPAISPYERQLARPQTDQERAYMDVNAYKARRQGL
jgi:hypothetical protein